MSRLSLVPTSSQTPNGCYSTNMASEAFPDNVVSIGTHKERLERETQILVQEASELQNKVVEKSRVRSQLLEAIAETKQQLAKLNALIGKGATPLHQQRGAELRMKLDDLNAALKRNADELRPLIKEWEECGRDARKLTDKLTHTSAVLDQERRA
jgi:chromosome segregation ATPase